MNTLSWNWELVALVRGKHLSCLTSGHQFENKLWVCNIGAGNLTATNLHALLWNTTSNSVWKVSRKISQGKNLKLSQLTTMKMYNHIVHLLLRELRWWGLAVFQPKKNLLKKQFVAKLNKTNQLSAVKPKQTNHLPNKILSQSRIIVKPKLKLLSNYSVKNHS